MGTPRNATLAETIYRGIEKNEYLNRIYADLLYNYSLKLFSLRQKQKDVDVGAALRFADILSKSAYTENAEVHKIWAQEIVILLNILYPDDTRIKPYLGSVLSAVGNFRGLSYAVKDYSSADILDRIYYGYEKALLAIPGIPDAFFFPAQKIVYDGLGKQCFSYSGPTSMGKSFVIQKYIKQQVAAGEEKNFAILVPTKALINEVRSNILRELKDLLKERNYRVVSSAGDIVLQQSHCFVFVMTPERMHHLLNTKPELALDFLFVDEAHKISAKGGRSAFYYKVIHDVMGRERKPSIVFASPNIPNPEIYLKLIPGIGQMEIQKLASRFSPVCQFKYMVDMTTGQIYSHNGHSNTLNPIRTQEGSLRVIDIVNRVGKGKQNIVYCNARVKVVKYAKDYADSILPDAVDKKYKEKLESLAKDIRNEVHSACFLAELVQKGVAYHVGYLPASIRLRIEEGFKDGMIRTMFCTSTLVEGVNLPADNLFITSYKNGRSDMNEVEFRNLVGRVGRIQYNLYGNVFMLAFDESEKVSAEKVAKKYESLLNNDIPKQQLSVEGSLSEKQRRDIVSHLSRGDVEMKECLESETEKDYTAMRKFALILMRDIVKGNTSMVTDSRTEAMSLAMDAVEEAQMLGKTEDEETTANQLYNFLYEDCNILRGPIDQDDYKSYVIPILFFKRLSDVYDEETQKAKAEYGDDIGLYPEEELHTFMIPKGCHWTDVRNTSEDVGKAIVDAMMGIEQANPDSLAGLFSSFDDANWTDKTKLDDERLKNLIEHMSALPVGNRNYSADVMGDAYEYLIKKFADMSKKNAGEFYTPRSVVKLMVRMLSPKSGESVYDPACGTGGMLIEAIRNMDDEKASYGKIYGQEKNLSTSAIARMNLFLHGAKEFKIVREDTLRKPVFIHNGQLQQFDCVLANPPFGLDKWGDKYR